MNSIQKFESAEFGSVRTTTDSNGKIYFCGKDVAEMLGYKDTVNALKTHCKKRWGGNLPPHRQYGKTTGS